MTTTFPTACYPSPKSPLQHLWNVCVLCCVPVSHEHEEYREEVSAGRDSDSTLQGKKEMDSPSRGGSASSKLLTAQLLDASTSRHEDFSARIVDNPDDERISHALPEDHDEASSPGEGGGGEGERTGKGGSTDDNERKAKGNGSSSSSNLMMRNTSSVESILGSMSRGSTIRATAPWKLTRAVVHVEDAWKGRFSPCPPLEKKEAVEVAIFKLRWKYRSLEFFVVHLLLCKSLQTADKIRKSPGFVLA